MTGARVVPCIVQQKKLHYQQVRYNDGIYLFQPGDDINVLESDFPRMEKKGHVTAKDGKKVIEIEALAEDIEDIFPVVAKDIWVFGDGPTAMMAKAEIGENAIVFGVNRCFFGTKTDGTPALGLIPDYYVALDDYMMTCEGPRIKALKAKRKFTRFGNAVSGQYDWPELRFFRAIAETGFSVDPMYVYHGKNSAYCALQLAVQCGLAYYHPGEITVHIAGIDLKVLQGGPGKHPVTHHYGVGIVNVVCFTRMLAALRYGLNHLNEIGVRWVNHSVLLADRIKDLVI